MQRAEAIKHLFVRVNSFFLHGGSVARIVDDSSEYGVLNLTHNNNVPPVPAPHIPLRGLRGDLIGTNLGTFRSEARLP